MTKVYEDLYITVELDEYKTLHFKNKVGREIFSITLTNSKEDLKNELNKFIQLQVDRYMDELMRISDIVFTMAKSIYAYNEFTQYFLTNKIQYLDQYVNLLDTFDVKVRYIRPILDLWAGYNMYLLIILNGILGVCLNSLFSNINLDQIQQYLLSDDKLIETLKYIYTKYIGGRFNKIIDEIYSEIGGLDDY